MVIIINILLVDDDAVDRTSIVRALQKSNLVTHIEEAATVDTGLELFSKRAFDIILLDYSMPDRDGIEMILDIKHKSKHTNTAIVMMSTFEDENIALKCIKAGAQDFLIKSDVSEKHLRRAILHATTRHDLEQKLLNTYHQVKNLAEIDTLTGLPNRYFFDKSLKLALKNNNRNEHEFALLLVDIDNFKRINDNFGHDVADIVLKKVSARISQCLRGNELFARLGGDEFAITLDNLKNSEHAHIVAQRIIDKMQEPIELANSSLHCTVSIGIALHPYNAKNSEELIKYADIAIYRAKKQGINQICFFEDEMQQKFYQRFQVALDLKQAITEKQFELYYQPILDPTTENLVGFEALIRWKLDGIILNPEDFIQIAEETKQITEIGLWVIEEAISTLSEWNIHREKPLSMSINISVIQLGDFTLVKAISSCLSKYNVPSHLIDIELTETALFNSSVTSSQVLLDITESGCHLSLDDFGTGYSSIAHLRNHPISTVKIDKSLMPLSIHDTKLASLVRGLVSMANILGLNIIAEGIETKEHADFCKKLNIKQVQGYFYSRPKTRLEIENTYLTK